MKAHMTFSAESHQCGSISLPVRITSMLAKSRHTSMKSGLLRVDPIERIEAIARPEKPGRVKPHNLMAECFFR